MERALAKLLSRRRSASGSDGLVNSHPKLSMSSRSRSMTGPVAERQEAFTLCYLGYSCIDDPRSTRDVQESIATVRESSATEKVVQLYIHKDSLVVFEESEKLLHSPLHLVYHCAQDSKGSSCFGVAVGSGHYMKQCHVHVFQAKSDREATDLVQVLQKLSKISKSKKSHRPQDTLRSVNSPVQKKVPKFQLPIRAGIFEEEEHNPLETKSLSTLSRRESRALSLGPSSSTTTSSQTSSLRSTSASEHAPILRLSSRLAPTPPQTKRTFFPSSAARSTKRNDEFTRKEKMEQVCSAVEKLLENNAHLRLLSSKSHPAGSFQDVIHAISEGNSKVIENYIDTSRTVVDACDGDQNSLLHYATAVGSVDMVNLLCSKGASVDAAGWNECRPVHRAAAEGNTGVLQALLSRGAMVNGTDLMRRTPLHMSAGDPKHLESSWVLIENGGQVTPCDVLGVRPLDLYPELERMQSKRIGSICGIFTATTLPNPHPASSSSSPSLNSRPNSRLIGTLVPPLVIGGIPLSSSDMDPLLLDLLADVDQVRIQARRMLYKSRRPHSHPPKRHRSFSNLEDLREDEEDKMAAQDRLLKYPSAFDLQSYHLSRVVADADVARSKLNELTDAIKRFSLVNRSGAEETKSDGEQPTNPLSSTKRWLSDLNMLDEVGGEGNRGNSLYIPLAISSNARPTSSEAILDSTRTDISAGEGGARERPDSVSSMATLTESSRRVGGAIGEEEREEKMMRLKRGRPLSQSPDAEGVVGPSMMEALDLLVKDFNRLSVTLDGDKEVTSPFPLTNAGAEDLKRRTCSSAVLERRERGTSGSTYLWTTRAPPTFETCVPRARRRRRPSLTASSPRSMKPGTPLVPSLRSQKRENSPLGAWSKLKVRLPLLSAIQRWR